jgi:PAS domain S-box-containing protein
LGRDLFSDDSQALVYPGNSRVFQAIVEECPLAIAALDRNGVVRMWSHGAEEMFGLTRIEAVGNALPIPIELLEAQLHKTSGKAIELTWPLRHGEPLHVKLFGHSAAG